MTTHRYWRLFFLKTDGGGVFAGSNCQFRTSSGGSNAATGGTASASSTFTGFSVANLFAGTGQWASNSNAEEWVQYDFGSGNPVNIVEFTWTARTDNSPNQAPDFGMLQYSDNGSTWTTAGYMAMSGWTLSQQVVFTLQTTPAAAHRFWGAGTSVSSGAGTGFSMAELVLATAPGGSAFTTGGTALDSTDDGTDVASHAFDGNTATQWATAGSGLGLDVPQAIYYDLGSGHSSKLAQARVTAESSAPTKSFSAIDFIYSDDGRAFSIAFSATPSLPWTTGQTQSFLNPVGEQGAVTLTFGGIKINAAGGDAGLTYRVAMHFPKIGIAVNATDSIIPPAPANGGITGGGIAAQAAGSIPDIRLSILGPIPQGYFLGRTAKGTGDVQLLPISVLPSSNQVGQALSNTQATISTLASIAQGARGTGVSQSTSLSQISASLSGAISTTSSLSSAVSTSLSSVASVNVGQSTSLSQISASLSTTDSTYLPLSGGTLTGVLAINPATITLPTAGSPLFSFGQSGGAAFAQGVSYGSASGYLGYRANGTFASPLTVTAGQVLVELSAFGYNGSAFAQGGNFSFQPSQTWTSSAQGLQFVVSLTKNGSVTPYNALIIDQSAALVQASTIAANLPSGLAAGARHFVTDSTVAGSGNFGAVVAGSGTHSVPVYYDGTNWLIG